MSSQLTEIALQMLGTIERMELIIPEITDTIRKALEEKAALAAEPDPSCDGEVAELVRRLRDFMTVPLLQERVRVADLLERLAEPDPVGPSDEEIEGVARLIYRAMQDATAQLTPDWTECGNSGMQDRARGAARAALARWGQP